MASGRLQQLGTESDEESDENYDDEEFNEENTSQQKQFPITGSKSTPGTYARGTWGRGGIRGNRGRGRFGRGRGAMRRAGGGGNTAAQQTEPKPNENEGKGETEGFQARPRRQQQQQQQQPEPAPAPQRQLQQSSPQQNVRGPGFNSQGVQGPGGRFRGEGVGEWTGKMPTSLNELFSMIPLETIMIENWVLKRLVLVGDMQPLDKALQRLNRHKITSLPIISETTGKIKGILDSLDIVYYLSTVLDQEGIGPARWDFNLENTSQLLAFSRRKALVISNRANMLEGIKEFAKGTPRLMVVDSECELHEQCDEEEGILGLFTQSDVIRFLGANPYWLNRFPKSQMTIRDLGIIDKGYEQVFSVDQNTIASAAFAQIAESNTRGVAVVDSQGRIVANLSATNIRGISRRNFQLLRRPLYEFLQRDRRRGWWTMPVCVKESDTFEKVVLMFGSTKIHQMYVIDSEGKPYAVVTHTDLMRILVNDNSILDKSVETPTIKPVANVAARGDGGGELEEARTPSSTAASSSSSSSSSLSSPSSPPSSVLATAQEKPEAPQR